MYPAFDPAPPRRSFPTSPRRAMVLIIALQVNVGDRFGKEQMTKGLERHGSEIRQRIRKLDSGKNNWE